MRYVSGFFTFLVALLLLCSSVFAVEPSMDDLSADSAEEATESIPSYVSLDPNTIQNFVDALTMLGILVMLLLNLLSRQTPLLW